MNNKKIKLGLLYFDAGNGHKSAVDSLAKKIDYKFKNDIEYEKIDIHKEFGKFYQLSPQKIHKIVSKNKATTGVFNALYNLTNTKYISDSFSKLFTFNYKEDMRNHLLAHKFDAIISVHYFATQLIGQLKMPKLAKINMIMDMVDIYHSWYHPDFHLHLVPSKRGAERVKKIAKSEDTKRILNNYFPLNPDFEKSHSKEETLNKLEFNNENPTVLLTAGGVGMAKFKHLIPRLAEMEINLIVICGNLKKLARNLTNEYREKHNIKIIGFADNMPELINAADIAISKPGPASIFELQYLDTPAIILDPIGKQEDGNYKYAIQQDIFIPHKSDIQIEVNQMIINFVHNRDNASSEIKLNTCDQIISKTLETTSALANK